MRHAVIMAGGAIGWHGQVLLPVSMRTILSFERRATDGPWPEGHGSKKELNLCDMQ